MQTSSAWLQGTLGFSELILILIIIFILFGGKKLPEIARSLGEAVREFRRASSELERPLAELRSAPAYIPYTHPTREEEILRETAIKLGIDVEGKTFREISDELTKRIGEAVKKD